MSRNRIYAMTVLFLLASLFSSCKEDSSDSGADASDETRPTDGSDPTARPTDSDSSDVCVSLDLAVEQLPVRVMILQDRSTSMNDFIGEASKWEWAEMAVETMVTQFENGIEFGLDFFPFGTERCDVSGHVMADTALGNAVTIQSLMTEHTTPPSSLGTPLYLALSNFVDSSYAPLFESMTQESYLVVISDGADTCGVSGTEGNPELEDDLAAVTTQLLNENRIRTFVIGFGDESVYGESGGIDADQLNAIAANGGTAHTQYINAQNGDVLREALSSIAESVHISCTFEVGEYDSAEANMDLVNVYFDKTVDPETGKVEGVLGRDDNCEAGRGWSWIDEDRTAIQFCEEACNALQEQTVEEISIEIMCSQQEVVII